MTAGKKTVKSWLKSLFDIFNAGSVTISGDVDLTKVGGTAISQGQKAKDASIPVTLASDEEIKASLATVNTKLGTIETDIETTNTKLGTIESDIEATNTKLEAGIETKRVEATVSMLWTAQAITEDLNTTEQWVAENIKEINVEVYAADDGEGAGSEITYTLMETTDAGSVYQKIKDKYGNDCVFTATIDHGAAPQNKIFHLEGLFGKIRVEAVVADSGQDATVRVYTRT